MIDLEERRRLRLGRINAGWAAEEERVARMLTQWKLRSASGGLGRANVIRGARASGHRPQAVAKVVSRQKAPHAVGRLIRYIARVGLGATEEPPAVRDAAGAPLSFSEAGERARAWSAGCRSLGAGKQIHSWHLVWSPGIYEGEDREEVKRALERATLVVLDRTFVEAGHDVMWVLHDDTASPHVHLVVQAQGRERKLWFDHHGDVAEALRGEFAAALEMAGLSREATRRVDRPRLRQAILEGRAPLRTRLLRRSSVGAARDAAPDWRLWKQKGVRWWERALRKLQGGAPGLEPVLERVFLDPAQAGLSIDHLTRARRSVRDDVHAARQRLAHWLLRRHPGAFGPLSGDLPADWDRIVSAAWNLPQALPARLENHRVRMDRCDPRRRVSEELRRVCQGLDALPDIQNELNGLAVEALVSDWQPQRMVTAEARPAPSPASTSSRPRPPPPPPGPPAGCPDARTGGRPPGSADQSPQPEDRAPAGAAAPSDPQRSTRPQGRGRPRWGTEI